ncbi:MAG: class B sortase [Alistipes sp.]|nr:class B sortase [Alistipes sp.]
MRNKIIKISAVVLAIALLFGGLFLLLCDDVGELIQQEKIKPYVPDFTVLESMENENQEEENTNKISVDAEEKLKEQMQNLCGDFDNSVGWINVPETKINYPIMYSGDNDFYLHRAVDGSYLRVGSIFLDYRCNADFTRKINVLYGHNMSDGSMFADVMKFIDTDYFDSHNYGWLTTENTVYKIDFFSLSQPENYDDFYNVSADVNAWLDDLRANSFIWRNIGVSEKDWFISLSTCTDSEGSSRTVLTGKLVEI